VPFQHLGFNLLQSDMYITTTLKSKPKAS
jgi:hypothetical protein